MTKYITLLSILCAFYLTVVYKNIEIASLSNRLDIATQCVQNVNNSNNPSFDPGPYGYLICDIDPMAEQCFCMEVINDR